MHVRAEAAVDNPFLALVVAGRPGRLPVTDGVTVVRNGRVVGTVRTPTEADDAEDLADLQASAAEARRARELAYYRQRYQRLKSDPVAMAKRKAWEQANREKRRVYRQEWGRKNRERLRVKQAAWTRRKRLLDPGVAERLNAHQRAYYAKNREKLLAKAKARRAAMTPEQRAAINAQKRLKHAERKAAKAAESKTQGTHEKR